MARVLRGEVEFLCKGPLLGDLSPIHPNLWQGGGYIMFHDDFQTGAAGKYPEWKQ
jgi:hypothetical protein